MIYIKAKPKNKQQGRGVRARARITTVSKYYTCTQPGCSKNAWYNFRGHNMPEFCADHRDPKNMIKLYRRACAQKDCWVVANWHMENNKEQIYCDQHKLPNCKRGVSEGHYRTCNEDGCDRTASFNFSSETRELLCFAHKLEGMVNVRYAQNRRCSVEGCLSMAMYRFDLDKYKSMCEEHKLPGMIYGNQKRCEEPMCYRIAVFDFVKGEQNSDNKGKFCFAHRGKQMVRVRFKTCRYDSCKAAPDEENGIFCPEHISCLMLTS